MDSYQVDIDVSVRKAIRRLPGNVRQRVLRILRGLEQNPRPFSSRSLDVRKAGIELGPSMELRRIRLGKWRIIYLIDNQMQVITVLGIRRRPPYQYDDLSELLTRS